MIGKDVPERYRERYERAMQGTNRADAVRLHCIECMGWQASEVKRCTATGCVLFPYRQRASQRAFSAPESTQTPEVVPRVA